MQGDSLPMALDRATQFILQGIRATFGYEYDNREDVYKRQVVESDLGERILQLMHLEPSHIVLPAIHIKREQVGELFEKEMGTEKGNFDPTYPVSYTHLMRMGVQAKRPGRWFLGFLREKSLPQRKTLLQVCSLIR